MNGADTEQADLRAIEQLADRRGGVIAGISPNDILVQIALPLVLILAIATRLITMSQAMMERTHTAVVLDLWKQQLILRMEQVLAEWERSASLHIVSEPDRLAWDGHWPADGRMATLFRAAQALDTPEALVADLYRQTLRYAPDSADAADAFFPLHDPLEAEGASIPLLHEDFVVTDERRSYALQYLRERALQWNEQVSALQWDVVARVVAGLPPDDPLSDGRIAAQMRRIAGALAERGYPLIAGVAEAYGTHHGSAAEEAE